MNNRYVQTFITDHARDTEIITAKGVYVPTHSNLTITSELTDTHNIFIIGTFEQIMNSNASETLNISKDHWKAATELLTKQSSIQLLIEHKIVCFGLMPVKHSRHNSSTHAHVVTSLCKQICSVDNWDILLLSDAYSIDAHIASIAKAFPIFNTKTSRDIEQTIHIVPVHHPTSPSHQVLIDNIRLCGSLVDQPPNHCHISNIIQNIDTWAINHPNVSVKVIRGKKLQENGLNGIWSVGKAAEEEPALVCLNWNSPAPSSTSHICWIGKGIIYDTGGLSIKSKTGMPGMKMDMAGAAAILSAFKAAVEQGYSHPLTAILCLAENAIGASAVRPDDIITMYSGKTVEINNTDAEGRLVLADGAAWAEANLKPDVLIDMATLTGAAATTVGKGISALYCNDEHLERLAIESGLATGEVCYPLPYIPENWQKEFSSPVADMKNSVARRNNAQSACAGQFIGNHLSQQRPWLHIDIAPAAFNAGRATSVGVHLLLHLSDLYCNNSN